MVNDLKTLMHDNVASPPPAHPDLNALVSAGRRRLRNRRTAVVGSAAALMAVGAAVVLLETAGPATTRSNGVTDSPPTPTARTVHLAGAVTARGSDYRVLATNTNKDLDQDNGHYFDGVTDDGLVLFRDGPRAEQLYPRLALVDPKTNTKAWLPRLDIGQTQTWPIELGADRLVLGAVNGSSQDRLTAYIYERGARRWTTMKWPALPSVDGLRATLGPDGRLYVSEPATHGQPPAGGWPTGPDGEADDADADGDTYHLWSVSLSDSHDVRDERLTVGDVAFADGSMVWTDSTNGKAGLVHVRNQSTGEEHSFNPQAGARCNLLSFQATRNRVILGQYCGTYKNGVRDDRVQILNSDGDQVVTIQGNGIELAPTRITGASHIIAVISYEKNAGGTYLYNLRTQKVLRLSKAVSKWALSGPTPGGQILWDTPLNHGHGAIQWLGQFRD